MKYTIFLFLGIILGLSIGFQENKSSREYRELIDKTLKPVEDCLIQVRYTHNGVYQGKFWEPAWEGSGKDSCDVKVGEALKKFLEETNFK